MTRSTKSKIPGPRPAHETKDQEILSYPFLEHTFSLKQLSNGVSNGTGLWLGGQCLSLYLADNRVAIRKQAIRGRGQSSSTLGKDERLRCIELGSGIGLGALAMAFLGWDVVATDTKYIVDTVLRPNVAANSDSLLSSLENGRIEARELDWTVPGPDWKWEHLGPIASHQQNDPPNSALSPSLSPPFDLIITSDTIYDPQLSSHLLRTMQTLSLLSRTIHADGSLHYPSIYIAVENRDPMSLTNTLKEAGDERGFDVERIPRAKLASALRKGGANWDNEEWDGVELWKLCLKNESSPSHTSLK